MPIKIVDQDKPLFVRLSKLIVHAQFVWWLGHITVVYASIFYLFSLLLRQDTQDLYYSKVFRGSILSYGIVIWKGHKPFQFNYAYLTKILNDETSCYLLLGLYWMFSNTASVAVIPFLVYSIFHCINYMRTRLFPAVFPYAAEELKVFNQAIKRTMSGRDEEPVQTDINKLSQEAQLVYKIQQITLEYYAPCMKLVSLFEVVVIPIYLFVGLFAFNVSIITLFIYGQFLLRRVQQSSLTLEAFYTVDRMILSNLEHPPAPPAVKQFYQQLRSFLSSLHNNSI